MLGFFLFSLAACQQQCEGIGCNIEPIESSLLLFVSPETAISDRTPDFASLTIKGNQTQEYDWGFAIDPENNLWLGTRDGSLYNIPYQIGTKTLENETPEVQILDQRFGQNITYIDEDYLLISSPLDDYSETVLDSGKLEIFYNYKFENPVLTIKNVDYLSLFPTQIWNCSDLDGDGMPDWIASTKNQIFLGLSTVWLRTTSNEILLSEFPSIEAETDTDGFAQALDCSHDFDQNGSIDLVISSPFYQGEKSSGKIEIYLNGWDNTPFVWLPNEGALWYGYSFAIGDIDGDEILDWSIFSFVNDDPRLEISSMTEQFGLELRTILEENQNSTFFGKRQELQDINGDGFDDLIVGAPFYYASDEERTYPEAGRIFFFYGEEELTNITQKVETFSGNQSYQRLGERFWLHDFNKDGRLDLVAPVLFP